MYRTPKKRNLFLAAAAGCGGAVLVLALATPSLLLLNGDFSDNWVARLGNIGQAYGVLSAVLSAVALIALAASLAYQARQRRDDRIVAWRSAHESLLRQIIDDPETFAPCIINVENFKDMEEVKRYLFTTLWLGYGRAGIYLGYMTETDLRGELLREMFESPVGRDLWQLRRGLIEEAGRYGAWYERAVDEEYRRAVENMLIAPSEDTGDDINDAAIPGSAIPEDGEPLDRAT